MPSPSGPRWASASVIAWTRTAETGAWSRLKMPAIPHTFGSVGPSRHDRDAGVFDDFPLDLQPGIGAPAPDVVGRLPVRVRRREPVVIDVVELLQREVRMMERLDDLPVEEALDADRTL